MEYEIVELDYSGNESKIYSIIPKGENQTLFEGFVNEYKTVFRAEIKDIIARLHLMGHKNGARLSYFKENEGKYGDFVCALFDVPDRNLRLYCIRFGTIAVILGGGGEKAEEIRAWQDDKKLTHEAELMIAYSNHILKSIDRGDIYWSKDKTELEGNLKNYEDE